MKYEVRLPAEVGNTAGKITKLFDSDDIPIRAGTEAALIVAVLGSKKMGVKPKWVHMRIDQLFGETKEKEDNE